MWDTYIKDNLNKLGILGHRRLSLAAFLALTGVTEGDEAYVEVDNTNGIVWHVRYNNSTSKWEVLGGPALVAEVATSETHTGDTVYSDLATVGPSLTVPALGDYEVVLNVDGSYNVSGGARSGFIAVKFGATATADADGCGLTTGASGSFNGVTRRRTSAALAASTALKVQYRCSNSADTITARSRRLELAPRRIG